MAQINPSYAERHVQVSDAAWTDISMPINCNKVLVRNGNASGGIAARITTDKDNAEAYDLIQGGDSKLLQLTEHGGAGITSFRTGDPLCAIKSNAAGVTDLFFTFLQ